MRGCMWFHPTHQPTFFAQPTSRQLPSAELCLVYATIVFIYDDRRDAIGGLAATPRQEQCCDPARSTTTAAAPRVPSNPSDPRG